MPVLLRRSAALGLVLLLAACGDDDEPFSPTVDTVAGSYSASSFTLTTTLGTTDLLALGASVEVTLAADGTTTGRLFVPGGAEGGGDLDVDLAGTWTLAGSTVTFDQTGDTFIRDVDFTATENTLTAEGAFEEGTVRLVLTRDD